MECHYCGYTSSGPENCAHCGSEYVYFVGTGSEKLEELLHGMFPQARIGRLDRDTVRGREDFEHALNALNEGALDMLVGTQMIAKGHDIHGVTLVGVVGADMALGCPISARRREPFSCSRKWRDARGADSLREKLFCRLIFRTTTRCSLRRSMILPASTRKSCNSAAWMHYPPYSAIANVADPQREIGRGADLVGRIWDAGLRRRGMKASACSGPAAAPIRD